MRLFLIALTVILFKSTTSTGEEEPVSILSDSFEIHGTLMVPESSSKIPVVLLIAGSGPTDRDGNQPTLKNNSLRMLAGSLSDAGIASLRFDKLGIGESTITDFKEEDLVFDDYVKDVKAWIEFLVKDARFSKIIVAGHSEGSLIGIIASSGNDDVAGFISIAGAGRPADELLKEQLSAQPPIVQEMVFPMIDRLQAGDTIADVSPMLYALFRPSVQPYMISWLRFDPVTEIAKLTIPILIVQGTTDIQVGESDAEMLAESNSNSELVIIENMNHVLKFCESIEIADQMKTYSDPDSGLHEALAEVLKKFIQSI